MAKTTRLQRNARIRLLLDALNHNHKGKGSLKDRRVRYGQEVFVGYCCLGVACNVFRKSTGKGKWTDSGFKVGNAVDSSVWPKPVRNWFGMSSADQIFLVRKNDENRTWKEVREYLREVLEGKKHAN